MHPNSEALSAALKTGVGSNLTQPSGNSYKSLYHISLDILVS